MVYEEAEAETEAEAVEEEGVEVTNEEEVLAGVEVGFAREARVEEAEAIARGVVRSEEQLVSEAAGSTEADSPVSLSRSRDSSFEMVAAGGVKSGSSSARRFSTHVIASIRLPARSASSVSSRSTISSATWASSGDRCASWKPK